MRRFPVTLLVLVAVVVAVVGGWLLFAKSEHDRFVAVQNVGEQRSEIRLTYTLAHTGGPIAREVWYFQNINGHSTATYTAVDRHGNKATFDEQIVNYDVTFLFDRVVADGIWELETRPFRGSSANAARRRDRANRRQGPAVRTAFSSATRTTSRPKPAANIISISTRTSRCRILMNLQSTLDGRSALRKDRRRLRSVRLAAFQGDDRPGAGQAPKGLAWPNAVVS